MVLKTIDELRNLTGSAGEAGWPAVEKQADIVALYETLADGVHRQAVVEISKGAFFAGLREDFLNLLEKVDSIADSAQNAARILAQTEIPKKHLLLLRDSPGESVEDLLDQVLAAVGFVKQAVQALASNADEAVERALKVEHAEEEADEIKTHMIRRIYKEKESVDPLTLLQLKDFILKLDEIADAAEDSSDIVISIVAKAGA